ncbi:AfsR/SARP family transcriptional regulator [Nonomuraea sp. CA-143628]|uniref:AfsR/SARP family transcriptional regulator n=1 Tax=Nonomuraea sp. CA-143628 TaxID=3239997 RepID=UPI003D934BB4
MALGVLAALVLNSGRELSAARLASLIWDEPPPSAMSNLRTHVGRARLWLRQHDLVHRLPTTRGAGEGSTTYRLIVQPGECDVQVFQDRIAYARTTLAHGRLDDAMDLFRQGLSMWEGPACSNVSGSAILRASLDHLDEQGLLAWEDYIEVGLRLGMERFLVREIRGLVTEHPTREGISGQLIRALYLSGDPHGALNEYERLRRLLREELGVDPSSSLQDLYRTVLRHDDQAIRAPGDLRRSLGHTA